MIKVTPLTDDKQEIFNNLFCDYYDELDCEDNPEGLVEEFIIPDLLCGLLDVDLLYADDVPAGFAIRQIDDVANDWCFRDGWGNIREIYIAPAFRRQGLGKFLLYTEDMKLKESGADKSYCLPCPSAESFFAACGYKKTDEYDEEFECYVFEKFDLNNCECHKR